MSQSSEPPAAESPSDGSPQLLRALGVGTASAIVVGNVIGSGIFVKPGRIAADVGDFPTIISAWILAGGICLLGAFCFSELAAMLPRAGGLYVYLKEAYGKAIAFLFGWSQFIFGTPASIGALAVAFVGAVGGALGMASVPTFVSTFSASVLIAAMAWINVRGVIWGGRVQVVTTVIKAGFLAVISLLPFAMTMSGEPGVSVTAFQSTTTPVSPDWSTQYAAALLAVMWAYNGWHGITPIAEEVHHPQRNVPLSMFIGMGILVVLYVGANCAYHGVLTMEEMVAAGETVPQAMMHKLFHGYGAKWANWGVAAMSGVIMCSLFGGVNSNFLEGPRISFAMGRDGAFFRSLGKVHEDYRTPAVSIIVEAVMAIGLVFVSGILVENLKMLEGKSIFEILTNYVTFSASIFYCLAVAAVIVLRIRHPHWDRPFRTWGYPVVPIVYLLFYAWFLYYVFVGQPFEGMMGLLLTAIGLPVYGIWCWSQRTRSTSSAAE
ncbi:MAG: amino acid permease [Planctomycetota bacterium]|nr:amino acid permease [Planctomycetota bacterium]MDA1212234.1 amino acid permease [Planctomycetota bacterium]